LIQLSPAFDNGTSMGHEIIDQKIHRFKHLEKIEKYIQKGTNHMKWYIADLSRMNHIDFLCQYVHDYPETKSIVMSSLQFDMDHFKTMLNSLKRFDVPVILTQQKLWLIFNLIKHRREMIIKRLEAK
jgi:hypothetical protein